MQNITVINSNQPELDQILDPEELLLWSGLPGYGRRFFEVVGDEIFFYIAAIVGVLVMWSTLIFIESDARFGRDIAVGVYGATTLAFFAASLYLANKRQYVLNNLVYFVTDKRAIICRRGRNWRLGVQLYVVSCPHSERSPYSLIATHPYPSLKIGNLLSVDQVQPFGSGLSHPGHPILQDRINPPITFDYIPNAQAVLEILQTYTCKN